MDHRYLAHQKGVGYHRVDERKMQVLLACGPVEMWDGEPPEEEQDTMWIPFEWDVCGTCDGRGRYVNPNIDSQGISPEEFYEDPDFAEAYFAGHYDVTCGECGGRRTMPKLKPQSKEQTAFVKKWHEWQEEEYCYARQRQREAEMGY